MYNLINLRLYTSNYDVISSTVLKKIVDHYLEDEKFNAILCVMISIVGVSNYCIVLNIGTYILFIRMHA